MRLQTATMMLLWFPPPPQASRCPPLSLSFFETLLPVSHKEVSNVLLFMFSFLIFIPPGWRGTIFFFIFYNTPWRETEVEMHKSYNYLHLQFWKCFHNSCFIEEQAWQKHWASHSDRGLWRRKKQEIIPVLIGKEDGFVECNGKLQENVPVE